MNFYLRVYDNFHYGDESASYKHGAYETYDQAVKDAQAIVVRSLKDLWEPGITPDRLMAQYCLFGDDPAVLPDERNGQERFSARTYASEITEAICKELEK
jgi:hypothetical protein